MKSFAICFRLLVMLLLLLTDILVFIRSDTSFSFSCVSIFFLFSVNVLIQPPTARTSRSKANVSVTYFFRNQKVNVPMHWFLSHKFDISIRKERVSPSFSYDENDSKPWCNTTRITPSIPTDNRIMAVLKDIFC